MAEELPALSECEDAESRERLRGDAWVQAAFGACRSLGCSRYRETMPGDARRTATS